MRRRLARILSAAVVSLGFAAASTLTPTPAPAGECSYYAGSGGFGGYCGGSGGVTLSWAVKRKLWNANPFFTCITQALPKWFKPDVPLPPGHMLRMKMRMAEASIEWGKWDGGPPDVEVELVTMTQQEINDVGKTNCAPWEEVENGGKYSYMASFWEKVNASYPAPVYKLQPTDVPRVNVKTFISIPDKSMATLSCPDGKQVQEVSECDGSEGSRRVMMARIQKLEVFPPGQKKFTCLKFHEDYTTNPNTPDSDRSGNDCWFKFDRSSANQPGQLYSVKIVQYWQVYFAVRMSEAPNYPGCIPKGDLCQVLVRPADGSEYVQRTTTVKTPVYEISNKNDGG